MILSALDGWRQTFAKATSRFHLSAWSDAKDELEVSFLDYANINLYVSSSIKVTFGVLYFERNLIILISRVKGLNWEGTFCLRKVIYHRSRFACFFLF